MHHEGNPRLGVAAAVGAFSIWGMAAVYWAHLSSVPPLEVIAHRVMWGGAMAWLLVGVRRLRRVRHIRRMRGGMRRSSPSPAVVLRVTPVLAGNGVLVVANWFIFVWAVSSGRTLDASLGYYINPLVSVLLGMVFLRERLTPLQWVALGLAAAGVVRLTLHAGVFPWASLALAGTFGVYGLVKKRTAIPPVESLALELLLMMVPAMAVIALLAGNGQGAFGRVDAATTLLLAGTGIITVTPLVLFGVAARNIRLADVGFLQYIAPTGMFLVAVFVFRDPIDAGRIGGFVLVWLALLVYSLQGVLSRFLPVSVASSKR